MVLLHSAPGRTVKEVHGACFEFSVKTLALIAAVQMTLNSMFTLIELQFSHQGMNISGLYRSQISLGK